MKKTISKIKLLLSMALMLIILSGRLVNVDAMSSDTQSTQPKEASSGERLKDEAGLLSDDEADSLLAQLDEISERQNCDVIVVTVASLDGKTAESYADDYFDFNGYGLGQDGDGILLLLSMEDRDWTISTHGFAITAFTDAGQNYMTDHFLSYISDGEYAQGFQKYAELCDQFLTQAKEGEPYDTDNLPKGSVAFVWLPIDIVIGCIIAFFRAQGKKKRLKTVRKKVSARDYIVQGSLKARTNREILLNRTVSSRDISSSDDSSSGSGGGSSTHTSSSGETHGGSSGKF